MGIHIAAVDRRDEVEHSTGFALLEHDVVQRNELRV